MSQLEALLLSIVLETMTIQVLFAIFVREARPSIARITLATIAATLISHPCAWALNTIVLVDYSFWLRALIIESLVVLAETVILNEALALKLYQGFCLSLAANTISFGVGLLLYAL